MKITKILSFCILLMLLVAALFTVSAASETEPPAELLCNLTLYSDFNLNVYVAKDIGVTDVTDPAGTSLMGSAEGATYGGREYYRFTLPIAVNAVSDTVSLNVYFGEGTEPRTVDLSITEYSARILGGEGDDADKSLILSMLNYANEASKLLDGKANAAAAGLLAEAGYVPAGKLYGNVYEVSGLASVITYGRLKLDSAPDFRFGVRSGFSGTVTLSYSSFDGKTVSTSYTVTDEVGSDRVINLENMRIFDLNSPITVTANGTLNGEAVELYGNYSLATYAHGIYQTSGNAAFAAALSEYSGVAVGYRGLSPLPEAPAPSKEPVADNDRFNGRQSVLLIGQSNMSGRGDLDTVEPISDPRILMMRDYDFVPMAEPIHLATRGGAGLSASFAKAFVETFDCELGLIPCAVGGTSLADWAVGGELYNEALKSAKAAMESSELCAILWHQGCSDMKNTQYAAQLQVILDSLIADLGVDPGKIVIVTGELGTFKGNGRNLHTEQINKLASEYENYGVASSEGLLALDVTTHFDAPSLRVFGYRYFNVLYKCLTGKTYSFIDDVEHYRVIPPSSEAVKELVNSKNFNSFATGAAVNGSGCSFNKKDGTIVVEEATATEKYLVMTNGVNASTGKATDTYFDVTGSIAANKLVVIEAQFKISAEYAAEIALFKVTDTSNKSVLSVLVGTDGKLYARQSGDTDYKINLGYSLDDMEWTKIKVVYDMANSKRKIYIEGNEVLTDTLTTATSDRAYTKVRVAQYSSGTGIGSLYVDNYKCYIPEMDPFIEYICNEDFLGIEDVTYTAKADYGDYIDFRSLSASSTGGFAGDPDEAGDSYVKLTKGDSNNPYIDLRYGIEAGSRFAIEGKIKLGEDYNGAVIDFLKPTPTTGAFRLVRINSDGALYDWDYSTGTYGQKLCELSSPEWTTVKLICDLENNTMEVYINGELIEGEFTVYADTVTDTAITKVRILQFGGGKGSVYVDYVRYWYVD